MNWTPNTSTTTWTITPSAPSLLVRISCGKNGFTVRDFVGTRYGCAQTLAQAVAAWAEDVTYICTIPDAELGDPLRTEVTRYREAFGGLLP